MNQEVANAISGYIQTLYRMNQKCILLCGADLLNGPDYTVPALELICDIPRVVPYKYSEGKGILISKRNGLLEFDSEIRYLLGEYTKIVDENKKLLDKVRLVRNKYEHKMHDVRWKHSSNGSLALLEMGFQITHNEESQYIEISLDECIPLLTQLNNLFDRIIEDIRDYAYDNKKTDYAYYKKICQHKFGNFNKIYESKLLVTVGKVFGPY